MRELLFIFIGTLAFLALLPILLKIAGWLLKQWSKLWRLGSKQEDSESSDHQQKNN